MYSLKSIILEHKTSFLATLGVFIVVAIIGLSVSTYSQDEFLAKHPVSATSGQVAASQTTSAAKPSTADSSTNTQTPTPRTASPTTAQSPTPNPQPVSAPFTISSVALSGVSWMCSGGGVVMYVSSAQVIAMSSVGGTFTWQIEVTGNPSVPGPTPSSVTIPKSQGSYRITYGNPGYIYTAVNARDGQSVRVHVTSPNDVASPWFTVPAGSEASCANS